MRTRLGLHPQVALILCAAISSWLRVACVASEPSAHPASHHHGAADCTTRWFEQRIDHFSWRLPAASEGKASWRQRYLVYDRHWSTGRFGERGPIFFYGAHLLALSGNEGNVEAYANFTGLMWENAREFGALLLFAEHRYYGESLPFGAGSLEKDPSYLTSAQALADYALLIRTLKADLGAEESPVIAFGGSYGGQLAAWMRVRYPSVVAGAIAASAPVGAFVSRFTRPPFDPSFYWKVVTYDASEAAGAAPGCVNNTRTAIGRIFELAQTLEGRQQLRDTLRLCDEVAEGSAQEIAFWIQGAYDSFAMGNYPVPSSYMGGTPEHPLPAFPMRAACGFLAGSFPNDQNLLEGLRKAVALLYNVTADQECFQLELTGPAGGPGLDTWMYQTCTELMPQEQPFFPANGVTDMFWDQGAFNLTGLQSLCQSMFGVQPDPDYAPVQYGGYDFSAASNIVFSNGEYDPWRSGGVLASLSETVVAVDILDGAHHLDLFYSHPSDNASLRAARKLEMKHVHRWVRQARQGRVWVPGALGGVFMRYRFTLGQ